MRWTDLLFLHREVETAVLRPLVPKGLEIDTWGGRAWLGIVPFAMSGVAPRGLPAWGPVSDFPEINVRTYVTAGGKPGVWFLSLDVPSRLAVWLARTFFHLPFFCAEVRCQVERDGEVRYAARRGERRFRARYRPVGTAAALPGSFAHWATERYCLYAARADGQVFRGEVHHAPWPLERAEVEIECDTWAGVPLGREAPKRLFSRSLEVVAWSLDRIV
jgi:uncharacterized protein YqjF (DUF2071 family)